MSFVEKIIHFFKNLLGLSSSAPAQLESEPLSMRERQEKRREESLQREKAQKRNTFQSAWIEGASSILALRDGDVLYTGQAEVEDPRDTGV